MVTGLSTNFKLQNGAFQFSSGSEKVTNDVWFLMNFDLARVYLSEYDPGLLDLVQRPASYLIQFGTIILGRIQLLMEKYVPQIKINALDLVYTFQSRKEYGIYFEYVFEDDIQPTITVKYIG